MTVASDVTWASVSTAEQFTVPGADSVSLHMQVL